MLEPSPQQHRARYETPACALEALLRAERLPIRVWEPAAGRGAIVDVLLPSSTALDGEVS